MTRPHDLHRDERGATVIELAFALPILVVMIWMLVQMAQVYRAVAGIQQGLGEGARYATLCLNPSGAGCTTPTAANVKKMINDSVYGIGPGLFSVGDPVLQTAGTSKYYDLSVTYTQKTNMLLFNGPTITVSRSKRVWVAGA